MDVPPYAMAGCLFGLALAVLVGVGVWLAYRRPGR
jgi:hypothetical protein